MRTLLLITLLVGSAVLLNFDIPGIAPEMESACTDCHAALLQAPVKHPPADKKCGICHASTDQPHPGDHKGFTLTNTFPTGIYNKSTTDTFALCWDCHDMEMMESAMTTTATNFRNGETNLHYVHIRSGKGRTCLACHNVHSAPNPHLVVDTVRFGNWTMKMNYIVQDAGGSCAPGCHGVKEYKR